MRERIFLHPWADSDKRAEMLVQRPPSDKPRPAVMLMHGHQEHPYQPGAGWAVGSGLFRSVLSMGYVAAAVSMPGYGRTEGLPDMCGPRSQEAVRTGLAHLRTMSGVDPNRIALCGWSRGAIVSSNVAADEPDLRALVLVSGVYDFSNWNVFTIKALREVFLYETELGGEESIRERSAILRAHQIQASTLILHGEGDDRTGVQQAAAFHRRLIEAGRPSRLVTYPGIGHATPRWQEGAEIMAFLKETLGEIS